MSSAEVQPLSVAWTSTSGFEPENGGPNPSGAIVNFQGGCTQIFRRDCLAFFRGGFGRIIGCRNLVPHGCLLILGFFFSRF